MSTFIKKKKKKVSQNLKKRYGPFKVANKSASKCSNSPFSPINKSERVKRLGAQLMVPLVIMLKFYVITQHNEFQVTCLAQQACVCKPTVYCT